jgi:hypothetical protein
MHEVREEPLPTLPYPYYRLPGDMTSDGQIGPLDPQSATFVRSVLMSGLPYYASGQSWPPEVPSWQFESNLPQIGDAT